MNKKENPSEICKNCPYYYGGIDWCMVGEPDVPDMEKMCKKFKNQEIMRGTV